MKLFRIAPLLLLGAALAANAGNDFGDRDALAELLTLDEQAPLADAEEALALAEETLSMAEEDLANAEADLAGAEATQVDADAAVEDAAQAASDAEDALAAAAQALADGVAAELPAEEIEALEAAVDAATAARDDAVAALAAAEADAEAAAAAVAAAEAAVDTATLAVAQAEQAVADATAVVEEILAEIEGTEELVASLGDDQVFALNRSLNNAVRSGLLPLDLDLALLQRILDEGFGNREIQALTQGVELAARFERHALRFEAKADASGNEKFLSHAERARARGAALQEKFHARLDGDDAGAETAAHEAQDAIDDVVRGHVPPGNPGREVGNAISAAAREHRGGGHRP